MAWTARLPALAGALALALSLASPGTASGTPPRGDPGSRAVALTASGLTVAQPALPGTAHTGVSEAGDAAPDATGGGTPSPLRGAGHLEGRVLAPLPSPTPDVRPATPLHAGRLADPSTGPPSVRS